MVGGQGQISILVQLSGFRRQSRRRARADYKTNSSRRSAGINKFRPRHHSDLQIAPRRVLTRDFDRSPLVARPSRVYDISGDDAFVSERFNDLRLRLTSCIGLDDSR